MTLIAIIVISKKFQLKLLSAKVLHLTISFTSCSSTPVSLIRLHSLIFINFRYKTIHMIHFFNTTVRSLIPRLLKTPMISCSQQIKYVQFTVIPSHLRVPSLIKENYDDYTESRTQSETQESVITYPFNTLSYH